MFEKIKSQSNNNKKNHDVIGIWDNNMKLLFISENVKQLLGYESEELLSNQWTKIITAEELIYIETTSLLEVKQQVYNVNLLNKAGETVFSKVSFEKVIDKKSDLIYYISITKGISNQPEKTSLTAQFAAGIAHEIRNPLTSLKGFLQLLQSGISEKDVYYQIMIEEIDKIETITSDLLLISKPLVDERQNESIYSMLHDVVMLLNSQAQLSNIKVILPETEEWFIKCDRTQIKQVFINII